MNFEERMQSLEYETSTMGKILDAMDFVRVPFSSLVKPSPSTTALQAVLLAYAGSLNLQKGPAIAGGSVLRAILGHDTVSDFDIFCSGSEQGWPIETIAGSMGNQDHSKGHYAPVFKNTHGGVNFDTQVCTLPENLSVEQMLLSFDFYISMIATDGKDILIHKQALQDIQNRQITVNEAMNPDYGDKYLGRRVLKYHNNFGLSIPRKWKACHRPFWSYQLLYDINQKWFRNFFMLPLPSSKFTNWLFGWFS